MDFQHMTEILRCPFCVTRPDPSRIGKDKGVLELAQKDGKPAGLRCVQCSRVYGFLDNGVPNMLIEEAVLEKA